MSNKWNITTNNGRSVSPELAEAIVALEDARQGFASEGITLSADNPTMRVLNKYVIPVSRCAQCGEPVTGFSPSSHFCSTPCVIVYANAAVEKQAVADGGSE